MNHENEAGAALRLPADGWILHSGGRQFGPLSDDELRRFFSSGMVKQGDALAHADLESPLTAANAAELLRLPPPGAGSSPAATPNEVRHLSISRAEPGLGWRELALWLTLLLAIQFFLVPKGSLGEQHSVQKFVVAVLSHFLTVGAACVLLPLALVRVFSGRTPSATWPMLAMTLVCLGQLAWWTAHPEAVSAPSMAGFVFVPDAIDSAPPAQGSAETSMAAPVERAQDLDETRPAPAVVAPAQVAPAAPQANVAADAAVAAPATNWDFWAQEANKLEGQQDWFELRNLAQRWTQAQPQRAAAWTALGKSLRHLRRWDESAQANRRAVELAPNDYTALFELGLNYSVNLDYNNAVDIYHRILSLHPQDAAAWVNLGNAYAGLLQHESAVSAYQSAAQFDAGDVLAWQNLGAELYKLNRFKESVAAYEKALALDPGNEDVKSGLQRSRQR